MVVPPLGACVVAYLRGGGVVQHGACAGGGVSGRGDGLCRDGECAAGWCGAGGQRGGLCVCVVVDACAAVAGGVARVSGWVDRAGVVPGVGDGAVADGFMRQMSEAGLKQMYGWALYASVALLLLLLLYDAPVRRGLKLMPLWTRLRREAEG